MLETPLVGVLARKEVWANRFWSDIVNDALHRDKGHHVFDVRYNQGIFPAGVDARTRNFRLWHTHLSAKSDTAHDPGHGCHEAVSIAA